MVFTFVAMAATIAQCQIARALKTMTETNQALQASVEAHHRRWMREHNKTVAELASAADVNSTTVQGVLAGRFRLRWNDARDSRRS
jgi:hypothetical protein